MPITVANLTSGEGQDTGTPFTGVTTAVNTVAGRAYFMAIGTDDTTSATAVTVAGISTAGGVTWSLVDRALADASNGRNLELWYGVCTETSSSVQWTISFANVTANATYAYFIDEATGSGTSGTIVRSAKTEGDSASPISATLAAFGTGNAAYAVALNDATAGTGTLTVEAGWTETGSAQNTTSNNITIKGGYKASEDTSPSFTGSGTGDDYSMIAVEIKLLELDNAITAIAWLAPASEYVNESAFTRQWMMPGGEYLVHHSTAAETTGHAHRKVNQGILHSKLQGLVH